MSGGTANLRLVMGQRSRPGVDVWWTALPATVGLFLNGFGQVAVGGHVAIANHHIAALSAKCDCLGNRNRFNFSDTSVGLKGCFVWNGSSDRRSGFGHSVCFPIYRIDPRLKLSCNFLVIGQRSDAFERRFHIAAVVRDWQFILDLLAESHEAAPLGFALLPHLVAANFVLNAH